MKKIISLLCVACLAFAVACSDDKEVDQAFDSVLTPDFTFDDSEEIIAGVDAVQFIDNSKAEGTEISGYLAFRIRRIGQLVGRRRSESRYV